MEFQKSRNEEIAEKLFGWERQQGKWFDKVHSKFTDELPIYTSRNVRERIFEEWNEYYDKFVDLLPSFGAGKIRMGEKINDMWEEIPDSEIFRAALEIAKRYSIKSRG